MAEYKPLVIEVEPKSMPAGVQTKWQDFSAHMPIFTRDIITPALSFDTSDVNSIVSGVPTAYARANLFNLALNYSKDSKGGALNLNAFYTQLASEWRGFIACIALDYSRIAVERVKLAYSDGKDIRETANIYEPKGAFGNMLFERKPLWCDLEADVTEKDIPFIDVIKYNDKDTAIVVGATSPDSLLFTSVAYKLTYNAERPFIDNVSGKFVDPLKNDMNMEQTLSLYAYVEHLVKNLSELEKYYAPLGNLTPKYGNLITVLEKWKSEIAVYANSKNFKLESASIPTVEKFGSPFSIVFNYKDEIYGKDGILSYKRRDNDVVFSPKELLLKGDAEIARLIIPGAVKDNVDHIDQLPVYVLPAIKKGSTKKAYFSLPLSSKGIEVFGNNIGALVGQDTTGSAINSKMEAIFDPDLEKNNLEIRLKLVIDNQSKEVREVYTVKNEINQRDIVMWPNFISRQWNRYFLYSELPHYTFSRDYPFKAVPFVGDENNDYSIINDDNNEPWYLAKENKVQENPTKNIKAMLHIESNDNTADNQYKYEIYESNRPFKGLKLTTSSDKDAGFLVIRYDKEGTVSSLPRVIERPSLNKVSLGVDFGSTNTSIAFYPDMNAKVNGIKFTNRRVSLLSVGDMSPDEVATEDRLLFFQGNPIMSNSVKSVLTLHDRRRMAKGENENSEAAPYQKEVKGGFPCFSYNQPVDNVDAKFIYLKCPQCGALNQVHNMKWQRTSMDEAYKKAFLKSLMLHVYAELFAIDEGYVPERLKWSYPSAMDDSLLTSYQLVWNSLTDVNPLKNASEHPLTISRYSISLGMGTSGSMGGQSSLGGGLAGSLGGGTLGGGSLSGGLLGGGSLGGGSLGGGSLGGGSLGGGSLGGGALGGGGLGGGSLNAGMSTNFGTGASAANPNGLGSLGNKSGDQLPELKADVDDNIVFDPVPMLVEGSKDFNSMTEACAVANYWTKNNGDVVVDDGNLTICFDIGGSTTDISALCQLNPGMKLTMIKQSSIRFAAQRVSQATKYSPNFKAVLLDTCSHFGLKIQGLNIGDSRFSPDTASYYFEQIVDRLDVSQLPYFYGNIGANCHELMCVNLYVTGLILFYAGMLTKKLVRQVRSSQECVWPGATPEQKKPGKVNIVFAGKGARIMEWLSNVGGAQLAGQYYSIMFIRGMGGEQEAVKYLNNYPEIHLPKGTADVKYEVSKGLAMTTTGLMRPREERPIEIIGESGFRLMDAQGNQIELSNDNGITPDMMRYIGSYFIGPSEAGDMFKQFCDFYYEVCKQFFSIAMTPQEFQEGWKKMNLTTYIKNMAEFQSAQESVVKGNGFDFVAPIIIIEGMRFYDEFLMKGICQQ